MKDNSAGRNAVATDTRMTQACFTLCSALSSDKLLVKVWRPPACLGRSRAAATGAAASAATAAAACAQQQAVQRDMHLCDSWLLVIIIIDEPRCLCCSRRMRLLPRLPQRLLRSVGRW